MTPCRIGSGPAPPDAPLESTHDWIPGPPDASAQENVVDTDWLRLYVWLSAGAGLFWLGIMFALTMSDYFSRGWR